MSDIWYVSGGYIEFVKNSISAFFYLLYCLIDYFIPRQAIQCLFPSLKLSAIEYDDPQQIRVNCYRHTDDPD